jgi:hypothetical protein
MMMMMMINNDDHTGTQISQFNLRNSELFGELGDLVVEKRDVLLVDRRR